MKKLIALLVISTAAFSTLYGAPHGRKSMKKHDRQDRHGMMFKLIESARVDLNLNEKQNTKLDKLLSDVKTYHDNMMKERQAKMAAHVDSFVDDNFDPEKFQANNEAARVKKREESKKFFSEKIKELHSILTKEQREKLVSIAKEKRENFRSKRKDFRGKRHSRNMN